MDSEAQIGSRPRPTNGLGLFALAEKYFKQSQNHEGLPHKFTTTRIVDMFKYVQEHPGVVREREQQLDKAIANFNSNHLSRKFDEGKDNARKLSKALGAREELPLLSKMEIPQDINKFFEAFERRILRGYYTFVQALEDSPKLTDYLVMSMLVDGYGLAIKTKKFAENGQVLDDVIVVNAVCEEVDPGILQDEIFETGWYNQEWGFSPQFCEQVRASYESRHPL